MKAFESVHLTIKEEFYDDEDVQLTCLSITRGRNEDFDILKNWFL